LFTHLQVPVNADAEYFHKQVTDLE
jgi:hypothetical protein